MEAFDHFWQRRSLEKDSYQGMPSGVTAPWKIWIGFSR
jgi:hypothetical protein